jgi:hypothetical protein
MLVKRILTVLVLVVATSSCSNEKKKDAKSTTIYSNLTTAGATDTTQNLSYTLTDVTECYHDSTTGFVRVVLGSNSTLAPFLNIKIKGYSSTAKTYSCTQAANNSPSAVGDLYDQCGVQIGLYNSTAGSSVNQYATFRETADLGNFNYGGTCSVTITEVSPTIRGTVSCTQMVQTHLESHVIYPITTPTTLNLSGDFYCTFGQSTLTKMQPAVDLNASEFEEYENPELESEQTL